MPSELLEKPHAKSFDSEKFSLRASFPAGLGGIYGAVRPDPIPNSVVKRVCADDSWAYVHAKVGSRLYQ